MPSARVSILPVVVLAACGPSTVSVPAAETGTDGESGGPIDDLPEDPSEGSEDSTETSEDPTDDPPDDDPSGDPTGPGARLPAYAPSCEFIGPRTIAFAPLYTTPESSLAGLRMGACGHTSTIDRLIYPDGSMSELGAWLSVEFAPTGELAKAFTGTGTIEIFDLEARTRRSLSAVGSGFVASFADGVASRVWTCADDRLELHDGANTWLLDDGLEGCSQLLPAQAAPILHYRDGAASRVVNTDTGVVTTMAFHNDAPDVDCHRELTVGYDGDAIAQAWICEEWIPGELDEPQLIDVLRSTSLYSTHTGLRVLDQQHGVGAMQVPVRGGAWWFSPAFKPEGSNDASVSVLVDGELIPLFERLSDTWVASDGTVFAIDRDDESGLGTLLRSDDGGHGFVSLGARPDLESIHGNWEGTAVAARTAVDSLYTGVDLWATDAWPWPQALQAEGMAPGQLFADGALILYEDYNQRTTLRSPTAEILVQWDEYRFARRLDARMVVEWGRTSPQLIPGGVALLSSDGSLSPLVPEAQQTAPWEVGVAPSVGIVAARMTDGDQQVLWYGVAPP